MTVALPWALISVFSTMPTTTRFLNHHKEAPANPASSLSYSSVNPLFGVPLPLQLTMFRFAVSVLAVVASHILKSYLSHRKKYLSSALTLPPTTTRYTPSLPPLSPAPYLLPSFSLFLANLLNSHSLSTLGISLTYVTKCAIPLFTTALAPLAGSPTSSRSLPFLALICAGIYLTAADSSKFNKGGLCYALSSCFFQVCLNLTSKGAMSR